MRVNAPFGLAVLLISWAAAGGCDARRATRPDLSPPPNIVCGETPPPVGERLAPASRGWSLDAGGGRSEVHRVTVAGEETILFGSYADTIVLDGNSLLGGGLFAVRVGANGNVSGLSRIATDPQARVRAAAATPERLWLAISFVDQIEMADGNGMRVLMSPGGGLALVALTPAGLLEYAAVARGSFPEWEDTRLTATDGGVLLTTTVASSFEISGDFPLSLAPGVDAFYPGHAVWVHLEADATAGWMVDGAAGSTLQAEMGGGYIAGRFGGDGLLSAQFGSDGPGLTSVSADDDPAWDVFVGRADSAGARWVERIRAYGSPGPVAAASHEGDLVVAVTGALSVTFREGSPEQVDVSTQNAIARFAPDGALRWAHASAPIAALRDEGCGLWGVGALWSPWVAQPGESDELSIEFAPDDLPPLVRLDGDGRVLAARTISGAPGERDATVITPTHPGRWLLIANRPDASGAFRFTARVVGW